MCLFLFAFVLQQQQILPPPRQVTTEDESDVNMREEEEQKDNQPEGESKEGVISDKAEQEQSEMKMEQESGVEEQHTEEHAKMPEHPGRDSDSGDSEEDEP